MRGRDAELAAIDDVLDRAAAGSGGTVVVEGGAGTGKSRLLSEAGRRAARRGFRVAHGVAETGDALIEMAALVDALGSGPAPMLTRVQQRELRRRPLLRYWMLDELRALLERAALRGPVLVTVDDLQWADAGTVAALRVLPVRLADLPVAWVLATRPTRQRLRPADDGGARTTTLTLEPLDDGAIAAIVADATRSRPDEALLSMALRTGGNPHALGELLAGLHEEDLLVVAGGRAGLVEDRLPSRMRESMTARLGRLSIHAREAVTAAAALERRFTADEVAAMVQRTTEDLGPALTELVTADLLVVAGAHLSLSHDLVRQAVRDSFPGSLRRALDRQAAGVLLDRGALTTEVAHRLAESADPGDVRAVEVLHEAAGVLAATDPGVAADLGRRALELAPPHYGLRGALVAQTAVRLHAALRGEEATAFVDAALHEVLPIEQEAEVLLSVARMFGVSPDVRADAGRRAVASRGVSAKLRAEHLATLSYNLVAGGRHAEAAEVHALARAEDESGQTPAALPALTFAEGCSLHAAGTFGAALETFDEALDHAAATPGLDALVRVATWWRCEADAALGRRAGALEVAEHQIAEAQRTHSAWTLELFEVWRGRHLLYLGRLDDAYAALIEHFDPVAEARVVYPPDAAGIVALGRIALHTGDERLSRQTAIAAEAMLDQSAPGVRRHGAWLLALQAMAAGDPLLARDRLCSLGKDERLTLLPLLPLDITDEPQLVRIAVAAGDQALAARGAESAARRAEQNPGAHCLAASAAYAHGLLTGDVDDLTIAVSLSEGDQRPLALAAVLEDLGLALARDGAHAEAVAALDRSLDLHTRLGASADAGRVRARLRELGVRRQPAGTQEPRDGWAGLSGSELAVVRLVAEGLTNREVADRLFLSPHTVNGHLRRVFSKLSIASRVELTRLAHRHDRD